MNNTATENTIRNLIQNKTDTTFCPPDSTWMHCRTTTYHPHSNECGPRTLLALHVLALHPTPYPNMLLPLMHDNIAQIARTWIASSILTGQYDNQIFNDNFSLQSYSDTRHTNRSSSTPFDIISWDVSSSDSCLPNDQSQSTVTTYHSNNSSTFSYPIITNDQPLHHHIAVPVPTNISTVSNSQISETGPTYSDETKRTLRDKRITDYIPIRTIGTPTESILHHHTSSPPPFGTPFITPDPTTNMRLIMQNTQYSFQLTHEDHDKLYAIEQLHNMHTSVLSPSAQMSIGPTPHTG
jgi:hypothetical protein